MTDITEHTVKVLSIVNYILNNVLLMISKNMSRKITLQERPTGAIRTRKMHLSTT